MAAIFGTARIGRPSAAALALLAVVGLAVVGLAPAAPTAAQGHDPARTAARDNAAPDDAPAPRRRAPLRVRVHRAPAVALERPCVAWYVEEARPSGTVITPRMQCWWARR